ncbi:4-hydroxy-tetrahydrodipicolinate synthase [Anaerotalea alkaliphila]|uniref:4-hydroxy-tetrahydrodipicolinate synthase n=1 Tax=Anaerotalea alkaliphila TaxID=2662126 RepID=A0A7X5KM72_9FIRM|nr:4-hydroxy-tetrahydrodipicolinate synthase [Anaerotalea alkaliphila]NDL66659.1 4-hydroxy-tetrahydrodipicolinate synthase [Anaerotalea alkaliphila]
MVEIKGVIPAILTPMKEDESVNYDELRNQLNRLIDGGVHGIFPFGTNGEGYILREDEKMEILKVTVDEVKGRVPVYAGTGCIGTKDTVRQSLKAKEAGADILSIIAPSFAMASQDELYEHYKTVAFEVDMPIVLYNIPARTNNSISPDTVERLSEIPNIVGVKDSSGNFDNMLQYIEKTRGNENFSVLSGNDSLILWNLLAGGVGGIAGCANIYPGTLASIYDLFMAGELEQARKAQDSIRNIRNTFKYGNPNTMVKTAVGLMGYLVGKCRAPFNKVSDQGVEALKKALAENEALGMK